MKSEKSGRKEKREIKEEKDKRHIKINEEVLGFIYLFIMVCQPFTPRKVFRF